MSAILKITKGIKEDTQVSIDLISQLSGLHVVEWEPSIASYKEDALLGVAVDNPISDFSESRFIRWDSISEAITVNAMGFDQDHLALMLSELEGLLRDASLFWRDEWSNDIVFLTVKGKDETNPRYAVLYGGQISNAPDAYNQPFLQRDASSVSGEFTVNLLRGHWMSLPPAQTACIEVMRQNAFANYEAEMLNLPKESTTGNSLTTRLVGLWPLNETSGSIAGESAGAGDGAYQGTPVLNSTKFIDGVPAVRFDDPASYVDIETATLNAAWQAGMKNAGTLSVWIKGSAAIWGTATAGNIFGITQTFGVGGEYRLRLYKSTTPYTIVAERTVGAGKSVTIISDIGSGTGGTSPLHEGADGFSAGAEGYFGGTDNDAWTNITLVWNEPAGLFAMYINGIKMDQAKPAIGDWDLGAGGENIFIGNALVLSSLGGPIDESHMSHVMLFSKALNNEEIAFVLNPALFSSREDCAGQFATSFYTEGRIDYVYRRDASPASWTNLSAQVVPYNLLPTVPASSDGIYFGSEDEIFGGLMLNLEGGKGMEITWQYWDGVFWSPLDVTDHTNGLERNGETAVVWDFPTGWVKNNPGMGVTAYWVRADVTSLPTSPFLEVPVQVEDVVYAASKPYVDIRKTDIGGDLPALGALAASFIGDTPVSKLFIGSRSLDRGKNFSAYLNAGRRNQPPGVRVFHGGGSSSFVAGTNYPGHEAIRYLPAGAVSTFTTFAVWGVGASVAFEYAGFYRAFAAIEYGAFVVTGDFYLRLAHSIGARFVPFPPVTPNADDDEQIVDLGFFSFPRAKVENTVIHMQALVVSTGLDITLVTLYLMPVDEWAIDIEVGTGTLSGNDTLTIDSTHLTDTHGRTKVALTDYRYFDSGGPAYLVDSPPFSVTGPLELHHHQQQRMWFMFGNKAGEGLGNSYAQVRAEGVKRYLGLRGNR